MALHSFGPGRSSRFEEADHDLAELLGSAGRKRRACEEAVETGRQRRRAGLWLAMVCALLATGVGAVNQLALAGPTVVSATLAVLGLISCGAIVFVLATGARPADDQVEADLHRCDDITRQLKALRRNDMPAMVESAVLAVMAQDLADIGGRLHPAALPAAGPGRRHERIPVKNRSISLSFPDGTKRTVTIRDISRSGVAVHMDGMIKVGAMLTLGQTPVRAVRAFPGGMAFEFPKPIPRDKFSPDMPI